MNIILSTPQERNEEREQDTGWNDFILKEYNRKDDSTVEIAVESDPVASGDNIGWGGWFTYAPWPSDAPQGKVGDKIRVWSTGSKNHGISLWVGDTLVPIYYQTEKERQADFAAWQAEYRQKQHEEFEHNKEILDAEYEKLPVPLKKRIDRFRLEDPDFRWKEEAYEMAACAEAGRLYRAALNPEFGHKLKEAKIIGPKPEALAKSSYDWNKNDGTLDWEDTPLNRLLAFDAINSVLNNYKYDKMKEFLPDMDDGHSGNTWSHAVWFARILLEQGDDAKL